MYGRYCSAAFCAALLAGCQRQNAVPDGALMIDETVALSRQTTFDTAARTLTVNDASIVVAIADEQLTDVKLKIAATDVNGKSRNSTEVENNLDGAGIEIASLSVPEGAHVTVTLTGAPDANTPGRIPLRVRLYGATAGSKP